MSVWFAQVYYLTAKLKQVHAVGEKDPDGNEYTMDTLLEALDRAGLTPEEHYAAWGRVEGLNPNAWFNSVEYLYAKTNQVNSVKQDGRSDWTVDDVLQAMNAEGMTPLEHYQRYGAYETDTNGFAINPSNSFDANGFFAAKLSHLVATDYVSPDGVPAAQMTAADVLQIFQDNSLTPIDHYTLYGANEVNADGIAMVQTVPVAQRVTNDAFRAEIGEINPTNYNPASPALKGVTGSNAAPVAKPQDVGGLADVSISPEVTRPLQEALVPGEIGYIAPPANAVDTLEQPIVYVPGDATVSPPVQPAYGYAVSGEKGINNIYAINTDGTISSELIATDDNGKVVPVTPGPVDPPSPEPPAPPPTPPSTFKGFLDDDGTSLTLFGTPVTQPFVTLTDSGGVTTVKLVEEGARPPLFGKTSIVDTVSASAVTTKNLILDVAGKATAAGNQHAPISIQAQTGGLVTSVIGAGDSKVDDITITGGNAIVDGMGGAATNVDRIQATGVTTVVTATLRPYTEYSSDGKAALTLSENVTSGGNTTVGLTVGSLATEADASQMTGSAGATLTIKGDDPAASLGIKGTGGPDGAGLTVDASAFAGTLSLQGTNFADTVTGGSGNDILRGFGGNDTLRGLGGNDTIYSDGLVGDPNTGTAAVWTLSKIDAQTITWNTATTPGQYMKVSVSYKGVTGSVNISLDSGMRELSGEKVYAAILDAITQDSQLSMLLSASNSTDHMTVTSRIDGNQLNSMPDISISLYNKDNTQADIPVTHSAALTNSIQGTNAVTEAHNVKIDGGSGDDLIVLSSSAEAKETVVFTGEFGKDTIINFSGGSEGNDALNLSSYGIIHGEVLREAVDIAENNKAYIFQATPQMKTYEDVLAVIGGLKTSAGEGSNVFFVYDYYAADDTYLVVTAKNTNGDLNTRLSEVRIVGTVTIDGVDGAGLVGTTIVEV